MQIEMKVKDGMLQPLIPTKFKHNHVMIEIADEEIINVDGRVQDGATKKIGIGAKLDQILGEYRKKNKAMISPEQDKAIWHKHLEEKHFQRDI